MNATILLILISVSSILLGFWLGYRIRMSKSAGTLVITNDEENNLMLVLDKNVSKFKNQRMISFVIQNIKLDSR